MTGKAAAILALLCFAAALLALGAWAGRRTHNAADFAVASRRLPIWLAAIGYGSAILSAPLLLLMSAAAFTLGYSAVWLWLGALFGGVVTLFYVAPRLQSSAIGRGAVTLIQLLSIDAGERLQPSFVRSAGLLAAAMLLLLAGAGLRAGATVLEASFGLSADPLVVSGVMIVAVCLFVGGLHATAVCDAFQGVIIAAVATMLLVAANAVLGGADQLTAALAASDPTWTDVFAGKSGVVAVALAGGGFGLGLAMCGQPQALNRFMALRDAATLRRVQWLALVWIALLPALVVLCGWSASALHSGLDRPEYDLLVLTVRPLSPWLGALVGVALAAALIGSIGAALFTLATSLAVDFRRSGGPLLAAAWMKAGVVAAALAAIGVGLLAPDGILDHALYAYTTLGAMLGPLLVVRLSGKRIRPGSMLGALWSAFVLSTLFHLLPDAPGDFLQRVLPFVAALGVALSGGERRRNPDRADR